MWDKRKIDKYKNDKLLVIFHYIFFLLYYGFLVGKKEVSGRRDFWLTCYQWRNFGGASGTFAMGGKIGGHLSSNSL